MMHKERVNILLVDNDTDARQSMETLLLGPSVPFEVVLETAADPSMAVDCLSNGEFDMALIGMGLPDDGWEQRLMRIIDADPNAAIVVLTEPDNEKTGLTAIRNGATDYLVKSQLSEELLAGTISRALARRSLEGKMKHAAQHWRTIFDSISDMVSVHDTNFKITRVNKAFAGAFGKDPKAIIGKTCYEIIHHAKEPCSDCPHLLTLKTGQSQTSEFYVSHLGTCLSVSTSAVFDKKGHITGVIHISRDISEQKAAEEKTRRANEKLHEYNELKDEFISTVSHELRTPLSIIQSSINLVLDGITGEVPNEQRDVLTMALDGSKWLTKIITSLLNLSRIETGKMQLQKDVVDLGKIIEDVVSEYRPLAREKVLHLDYTPPECNIDICLDPDRIKECLSHLISNSIKFTPTGGKISVTCTKEDDEIQFSVQDSGVGISEKDRTMLFDKFTQFNRKAGSTEEGTGLGLAITKKLVEMHGGQISVESEIGQGATFTVSLPLSSVSPCVFA